MDTQVILKDFLPTQTRDYANQSFFLIAGPCVVESEEMVDHTCRYLSALCHTLQSQSQ
jgi:3-deoxy-D-manno-octulosonic acid (KDO) 8-phosphate synthase